MIRIRYENILMYFWPFFLTCMFVIELWKEGRVTCFSKKSKHTKKQAGGAEGEIFVKGAKVS